MSKSYEIVQLDTDQNLKEFDINGFCPNQYCPNAVCPPVNPCSIGICTCPPPPPDSGCPLAICGPEMAKNPGNR
ncbi:hypothetical protein [Clostridium tetani]|uniref:hypothetical protein n=1 Tax=Clostridium tetani TaxID=1513 RepID=UPI0005138498|nr:hypothetical protein [Clostridium tetani]KGI36860.1 hypothetical protein LA33_12075 [Clostridium tetani ATCC 9441]SUY82430.1 Uncharacterised protein [Clostridium tetani]